MSNARRLDDRAHSILFDGGSWPNGRRAAARICALAAVPAGLIPCAYLLNDSGADRSAVLVLSVVVLAGLTLTNVVGLSGTAKYGPLAGAVLLWAVSVVGIFVTYVFIPAALLASAAALLGVAPRRR